MKITIDVSEFWIEEEALESGLKASITNDVIDAIRTSIKEKVEKEITVQVKEFVLSNISVRVQEHIDDIVKTGLVRSNKNRDEITIEQYIREALIGGDCWTNFENIIRSISEKLTAELKARYDVNFATRIVQNMQANKLLRDDVAQLILTPQS